MTAVANLAPIAAAVNDLRSLPCGSPRLHGRIAVRAGRLFAEMHVRVARDGPHVFAVLALEPEQTAFRVGRRKRRTPVAVAFRAMLRAVVVMRGLRTRHGGADPNYGSA